MLVENWNKIYGNVLYTPDTMYEFVKDTMTIATESHVVRINPISGKGKEPFTIVVTKAEGRIKCGIYLDKHWNPIEIFEMSRMDLKTMDTLKKLLSYKIANHE